MNTNSLFRQMRILLFYDLPTTSKLFQSMHNRFRNKIKSLGFFMLQESVYVKHCLNFDKVQSTMLLLEKLTPKNGDVRVIVITEHQYAEELVVI